jgi:hypothetical protein
MTATERCAGCGLEARAGAPSCRERFFALLARGFAGGADQRVHRLMVDAYALQHPDEYCASAVSLAAHLTGLAAAMSRDDPAVAHTAVQRWLSRRPRLTKPALPAARGHLTIADLPATEDPQAHAAAIECWGRMTWEAYAPLHELARSWLDQAAAAGRGGGGAAARQR